MKQSNGERISKNLEQYNNQLEQFQTDIDFMIKNRTYYKEYLDHIINTLHNTTNLDLGWLHRNLYQYRSYVIQHLYNISSTEDMNSEDAMANLQEAKKFLGYTKDNIDTAMEYSRKSDYQLYRQLSETDSELYKELDFKVKEKMAAILKAEMPEINIREAIGENGLLDPEAAKEILEQELLNPLNIFEEKGITVTSIDVIESTGVLEIGLLELNSHIEREFTNLLINKLFEGYDVKIKLTQEDMAVAQ